MIIKLNKLLLTGFNAGEINNVKILKFKFYKSDFEKESYEKKD